MDQDYFNLFLLFFISFDFCINKVLIFMSSINQKKTLCNTYQTSFCFGNYVFLLSSWVTLLDLYLIT